MRKENVMSSTESFETERVDRMRHTLSHVMATALTEMYPGIQFGVGPAIKDGFYYDVDLSKVKTKNGEIAKISDTDLVKIEKCNIQRKVVKRQLLGRKKKVKVLK